MKESIPERQYHPIGHVPFLEKRKEMRFNAVPVANHVEWVNPKFSHAPFSFKKEKTSSLGLFFVPDESGDPQAKRFSITISPELRAGRSGMLDPIIFQDDDGNYWRDIDFKGMGGYVREGGTTGKPFFVHPIKTLDPVGHPYTGPADRQSRVGILDNRYAQWDRQYTEILLNAGIRAPRVIAILALEQVPDSKGNLISLQEASKRDILPSPTLMHPVIEVRAYVTKERISYLAGHDQRARLALDDARKIVAQELKQDPDHFSLSDYLHWYARTLGEQLAKLRKENLYHGFLHSQNLTLDCRFVDFDSMIPVADEIERRKAAGDPKIAEELFGDDFMEALYSFYDLLKAAEISEFGAYQETMESAYEKELKTNPLSERARRGIRNMFTRKPKLQR